MDALQIHIIVVVALKKLQVYELYDVKGSKIVHMQLL
jgi:hypothetical protein